MTMQMQTAAAVTSLASDKAPEGTSPAPVRALYTCVASQFWHILYEFELLFARFVLCTTIIHVDVVFPAAASSCTVNAAACNGLPASFIIHRRSR